jgi:secondary thiamine-phosphate synthase enzyme
MLAGVPWTTPVDSIVSPFRLGYVSHPFRPAFARGVVVETTTISVRTGSRDTVRNLTSDAESFVEGKGDGLLSVFVPHATAGVAVLELGAGSDTDLLSALQELLPADDRWQHAHGSKGHGRSHVMPAFIAPSLTVPVLDGRLALGTWQSIALVDLNVDNDERTVRFTFLPG